MKYFKTIFTVLILLLFLNSSCSGDKNKNELILPANEPMYDLYSNVEVYYGSCTIPFITCFKQKWSGLITLKLTYIGKDRPNEYDIHAEVPEEMTYEVDVLDGSEFDEKYKFPTTELVFISISSPKNYQSGEILMIKVNIRFPKEKRERIIFVPVRVDQFKK